MEAKLLNRNVIGVHITPQSILLSETNLQFQCISKSKVDDNFLMLTPIYLCFSKVGYLQLVNVLVVILSVSIYNNKVIIYGEEEIRCAIQA